MIKFYFGDEKFLVFSEFQKERLKFGKNNPDAHIGEFDFKKVTDLKQVSEELVSGGGLFASQKMLILRDVNLANATLQDDLIDLLKNPIVSESDELVVLIVVLEKGKLTTKLKGFLTRKTKRKIEKFEFKKKKGAELEKWITSELKSRSAGKVGIGKNSLQNLILLTNGDLWKLNSEMDKLICYVEEGDIQKSDVEKICNGNIEAGIFDLVDAIGQKKLEKAMTIKNRLIAQGDNEFFVFSMILSQVRNLVKVRACVDKNIFQPDRIAKTCKLHPFVAKKTLAQINSFSKNKLKGVYNLASKIDKEAKLGQRDMGEALDYFIAKI